MRTPQIAQRHPALRWAVPFGVLAFAVSVSAVALTSGSTGRTRLPSITAQALMAQISEPKAGGFSGTFVAQMPVNLPMSTVAAKGGAPVRLMAGAHSLRFWYGGPDRQRIALLGASGETDVFQVGTDLWQWDSQNRVAAHSSMPPAAQAGLGSPVSPAPLTIAALTPQELAVRTLAAVDDTTGITVEQGPEIADRSTYELVLAPGHADSTRISSVHIQVDASKKIPLGVQVYARGLQQAAIDVAFSSVIFKTPAPDYFAFSPPVGASVVRGAQPQIIAAGQDVASAATQLVTPGIRWSSITEYRTPDRAAAPTTDSMRTAMRSVSGKWGSGKLLETPLLCMLLTDDGRVFTGTVNSSALYAAAIAAP